MPTASATAPASVLVHPLQQPVKALVVDADLKLLDAGETGELCIIGPGVAQGYLGRPELTAEKFVANPWMAYPGEPRLYRTGDLGRWRHDGAIEYLGRIDHQVKIRGFRVEPEEIERCLRDSQLYRQVAVVIDAQRRILAFLAQPQEDRIGAARQALKEIGRAHV